jgi:hypothetical protein
MAANNWSVELESGPDVVEEGFDCTLGNLGEDLFPFRLESEEEDSLPDEGARREKRFFRLGSELEEESLSFEELEPSDELEEAEEGSGDDSSLFSAELRERSFRLHWYSKSPSSTSKHRRA